jgi:hypothetical protein
MCLKLAAAAKRGEERQGPLEHAWLPPIYLEYFLFTAPVTNNSKPWVDKAGLSYTLVFDLLPNVGFQGVKDRRLAQSGLALF